MKTIMHCCLVAVLGAFVSWWPSFAAAESPGNRLAYVDGPVSPYYVGRKFPKLTTPQWIGEEGVEAVVVLAIDDMREVGKYEAYLRPILDRLKQIDGRAPVSIMTCRADPSEPTLQKWLGEGLSIEVHTYDHPCPCLQKGDFDAARRTYQQCVDLMADIQGNQPVAFRMPCCDSRNTPSPRFWAEIFNQVTPKGRYLQLDSSVFNVLTPDDPDLPRDLVLDQQGQPRFRRYLPFPSFVNTIDDYPYPYVIGKLCWQFPCVVPSDWEAQHVQKPNNPQTVADMKLALDATVIKRGVYNLVFHPHGWIRNDQVVDLIDHAVQKHGNKVKFLTFREAAERLNRHLLRGQSLRAANGQDNGVRLLDVNNDGYLDVLIDGDDMHLTRVWDPARSKWQETRLPYRLVSVDQGGRRSDSGARFGVVRKDGAASLIAGGEGKGAPYMWHFVDGQWQLETEGLRLRDLQDLAMTRRNGDRWIDLGVRLRDLDGDGICELLVSREPERDPLAAPDAPQPTSKRSGQVFRWTENGWKKLPIQFPAGCWIVDLQGRDAGLRLVDLNGDRKLDLVFSNHQRYAVHLLESLEQGWGRAVRSGNRDDDDAVPMIVRNGTNNGAWFHSGHLWVQNEDTTRLPDGVDRMAVADMLKTPAQTEPAKSKDTQTDAPPAAPSDPSTAARDFPTALSPEESLAAIRTRPGIKVQLVAAEPLVVDPVAIDWGPDGRLWVVEMRDYPNGMDGQGKPGGRVKVLTDDDGDGVYDRAAVFLPDLPFPTGIKVWRNGVLVTAAPDILYAEDTDGDDRADVRTVLFTGFGEGNQQHRVNGLRWGLDNWLHLANGDSGGKLRSTKTNQQVDFRGRDLRIEPDLGLLDPQSGQTQFGRNRDDWGNWFGGNNSNPMWHFVLDDRYLRRNPFLAVRVVKRSISQNPGAAAVFPQSRTLARFNDFDKSNRFTSACSPIIYRDNHLGPQFDGNAFICEPVHNLVHREVVSKQGTTFVSRRADDEQQSEFLASADSWFRPTMVRTGPDGSLWITDMYRLVIEHPKWIPQQWQQQLNLRDGDDRGRIYRVFDDKRPPRPFPKLHKLDNSGLIDALASPNGWQRDMAHQMLLWQRDPNDAEKLSDVVRTSPHPLARLHALSILDGFNAANPVTPSPEVVRVALHDHHPSVRRNAVRVACGPIVAAGTGGSSRAICDAVMKLVDDPDPSVRLQVAYTLGHVPDESAAAGIAKLARSEDPFIRTAAISSLHRENIQAVVATLLESDDELPITLIEPLLGSLGAWGDGNATSRSVVAILSNGEKRSLQWRIAALANLVDNFSRRGIAWYGPKLDKPAREAVARMLVQVRHVAVDNDAAMELRRTSIRLVGRDPDRQSDDLQLLARLIQAQQPPEVQAAAVQQLTRIGGDEAVGHMLREWTSQTPDTRNRILDALLARKAWTLLLLKAIESKDLPARVIDARRRQQLANHPEPEIRRRTQRLLPELQGDRAALVRDYRSAANIASDREAGQQVFKKHCAACHRLGAVGTAVGPDLTAITDRSAPALLTAILDPNQAVETKYLDYVVVTDDGRQHNGMLIAETGASLTLANQQGKQQVVLRREIDEVRATGKSLMPEGLEQQISVQQMADLLAFVRSARRPPKRFAGNVPQLAPARDDGSIRCLAMHCRIYGPTLIFEPKYRNLGYWQSADDRAVWSLKVPVTQRYRVAIEYACDDRAAGDAFLIHVDDQHLSGRVKSTGSWDTYRSETLGEIVLKQGPRELIMRSDGPVRAALIDLRSIRLTPLPK